MNVNDRVQIGDAFGTHKGTVNVVHPDGMCAVKWDVGTTERVHESELRLLDQYGRTWPYNFEVCAQCGQPDNCSDCNHSPYTPEDVAELGGRLPITPAPLREQAAYDTAYEPDDPSRTSLRERLAVIWDSRPGK